jgi:iron complex transport system ATP-binding protein
MDLRPCIRLRDLVIASSGKTIYDNLQLTVPTGCVAVITGAPSPGWNALLHVLAGMQPVQGGQLDLWGYPIAQIGRRDMNANISYLPRHYKAIFDYTAGEFIQRGCEVRLKPLQGIGFAEEEQARQIMAQMKIERLASRESDLLNNAEHQKVGLARALMQQAHLLLLDEPLISLNEEDQATVMSLLRDYARQNQKTVLATMADPRQGLRMVDLLIVFGSDGILAVLDRNSPDFDAAAEQALAQARQIAPVPQASSAAVAPSHPDDETRDPSAGGSIF